MKTAISIPDAIFREAERAARRLGMSRSELYSKAVQSFLERHRYSEVTEQLDRVYRARPARLDPVLEAMQAASLEDEDW